MSIKLCQKACRLLFLKYRSTSQVKHGLQTTFNNTSAHKEQYNQLQVISM